MIIPSHSLLTQTAVVTLLPQRHALELIQQPAPVVCQHLGVLDALARPVLIPPADVVLRRLECDELISQALLDKDAAVVLLNNRLLVLLP